MRHSLRARLSSRRATLSVLTVCVLSVGGCGGTPLAASRARPSASKTSTSVERGPTDSAPAPAVAPHQVIGPVAGSLVALVSNTSGIYVLVSGHTGAGYQVLRVDPVSGRALAEVDLPGNPEGSGSQLVITGSTLWLAVPLAHGAELVALSASDLRIEHRLLLPGATYATVAAAGSYLWVAAGGTLYQVSTQGKITDRHNLQAPRSYLSVDANPGGTELVAEVTLPHAYGSYLELLDPHTGRSLAPVPSTRVPGDNFGALAFSGPLAWSSQGSLSLTYVGTDVRTGRQVTAPVNGNDATLTPNGTVAIVASPENPTSDCVDVSTGQVTASFHAVGLRAAAADGWVYYTHPSSPSGQHYQLERERVRGCG